MKTDVEQQVNQLVQKLQTIFQSRLVSVVVYGSAVSQTSEPALEDKYQNINVLAILDTLTVNDLEKAASVGPWWNKIGHALPILMSREEWERSADVFALEYADIRDQYQVVYGADLFSPVTVDKTALRLICELELHRKLIYLRQRLLIHREAPKQLLEEMQGNINSVAALFRGVLRLTEKGTVPYEASAVFEAMANLIPEQYDATPMQRVLRSRQKQTVILADEILPLFRQVVDQLERVTAYVDQCFGFLPSSEKGVCS